ncbi:hypothetical protein KPSA3_01520 [Pseudomonas syringae pv. actinidiae]|uniref:Uncharacterized protein n=1 Tax=Pseudomonas syringae pv. actinidiae TaxID=103796 RepID=A0AAN4Q297_PSESF|nr:hypothetical protein KPSA3_01520 [Pseudomonas syringae pv. actinidiae]
MPVPAIPCAFPVRMHIAVARPFRLPVAVNQHVSLTIPVPVTTRPHIAGTRSRFDFDYPLGRRLRRDDFFDVFVMCVRSLMNDSLLDTT